MPQAEYKKIRTPLDQDFCSADIKKSLEMLDFKPNHILGSELKR